MTAVASTNDSASLGGPRHCDLILSEKLLLSQALSIPASHLSLARQTICHVFLFYGIKDIAFVLLHKF